MMEPSNFDCSENQQAHVAQTSVRDCRCRRWLWVDNVSTAQVSRGRLPALPLLHVHITPYLSQSPCGMNGYQGIDVFRVTE
jgi:hypothetical protein